MAVTIFAWYRNSPNKCARKYFSYNLSHVIFVWQKTKKKNSCIGRNEYGKKRAFINDILKWNYNFIQIIATFIYFGLWYPFWYIYTYQVKNFHVAVTDNVIEKTNLFIGRLCINIDWLYLFFILFDE